MSEIRITDAKTGGQKGQKLERYDLIPFEALDELARTYGVGATKYEDDNWRKGYRWRLSIGAMLRHVSKFVRGHSYDTIDGKQDGPKEEGIHTGCHHLACAAWHCFTLYTFDTQQLGTDDRAKGKGQVVEPKIQIGSKWYYLARTDWVVEITEAGGGIVAFKFGANVSNARGRLAIADFLQHYSEIN